MPSPPPTPVISLRTGALLAAGAVTSFQLAFGWWPLCGLAVVYLICLVELRRLPTSRQAFYGGVVVGLGVFVPQTIFLWNIFKIAAAPLWVILAFWHGLFVLILHNAEKNWGTFRTLALAPAIWMGIEYFRSELYYLRFSWFTVGSIFADGGALRIPALFGIYGSGFAIMVLAALLLGLRSYSNYSLIQWLAVTTGVSLAAATLGFFNSSAVHPPRSEQLSVAGVQLEFPAYQDVFDALNRIKKTIPLPQLIVLSEYTFDGPPPKILEKWCKENHCQVLAGAKQVLEHGKFYNTAFLIGPTGGIVFQQAKAVPIQFFQDGTPAPEQKVWESPWGRLGICVCYDLSYARVTDELVRQGALALIVPAMDIAEWGQHQHELNRRITCIRAAEYGIPIFRLASSGISQIVNQSGFETATAPFPGQGEIIHGELALDKQRANRFPIDRHLAEISVGVTGVLVLLQLAGWWRSKRLASNN